MKTADKKRPTRAKKSARAVVIGFKPIVLKKKTSGKK
jgi:hypothetical protein